MNKKIKNKLLTSLTYANGRNSGKIAVYTKIGAAKRKYRLIDFKRSCVNVGYVKRVEYDPNRSAFIALICYLNGALSYIISVERLQLNSKIINYNYNSVSVSTYPTLNIGDVAPLTFINPGTLISNLELYPGMGSSFMRAAGTWAQIVKIINADYTQVKLRSGEQRLLRSNCKAVVGVTSNIYNNQTKLSKAGQSFYLGVKPNVRGRAMNPVDHPHGGRTNGGVVPKTPWGKLTKNSPTRSVRKSKKFIINKTSNLNFTSI